MLQLTNRVKFYNSDVDNFLIGKYDIVVSNPPYIELLKFKIFGQRCMLSLNQR